MLRSRWPTRPCIASRTQHHWQRCRLAARQLFLERFIRCAEAGRLNTTPDEAAQAKIDRIDDLPSRAYVLPPIMMRPRARRSAHR
jgi:hypothetical protein